METRLRIEGMSCQNCVRHAREALLGVEGVTEAEVDLAAGSARVVHDDVAAERLIAAIEEEGYVAALA